MKPTNLIEHPEGGRYRQVFKSNATVKTTDGRSRSAITHIYFSLEQNEASRFHRVASDEIWNLYEGAGIRIVQWDDANQQLSTIELSAKANEYCHVVPAGIWQAAEPMDDAVLVGCSVGPGFEFDDFALIDPNSEIAGRIEEVDSGLSRFIR